MKRGLVVVGLILVLMVSLSFVSAGWFGNSWNKITGKVVVEGETAPLYRLWSSSSGDHFYTTDDYSYAVDYYGYKYETIEGYVFTSQQPGTVPLYRLWNSETGDHFYTTDDYSYAVDYYGYKYETIAGYIYSTPQSGTVPLYRLWNSWNTDHFYTISATNKNNAVNYYGYKYETIAGYVYASQPTSSSSSSSSGGGEEVTCTDSDGGKDYYVKGMITFYGDGGKFELEDACGVSGYGKNVLEEWYCESETEQEATHYDCSSEGKICQDGVCVEAPKQSNKTEETNETQTPEPETTCNDSDGGLDYYMKGETSGLNVVYEDYCYANGVTLQEQYCNDLESPVSTYYNCPFACLDGACVGETVPLYRLWKSSIGDHFYTTSATERSDAVSKSGYKSESVQGYILVAQQSGTVPLYRLWKSSIGDHFYTTSKTEKDSAVKSGYKYEKIMGYVFSSQQSGTVPLYRLWKSSIGDHFYTISKTERDNAVAKYGYKAEKTIGYVYASQPTLKGAVEVCDGIDNDGDGLIDLIKGNLWINQYENFVNTGILINEDKNQACIDGIWTDIPASLDWRNKDGKNWMTSVKDQGDYGNCWAFATLGMVESVNNIKNNNPDLDINLAEQDLVCASPVTRNSISATAFIKTKGVLFENCLKYKGPEYSCSNSCEDNYHINYYRVLGSDPLMIKAALMDGPLAVSMYYDFYLDSKGIYRCKLNEGDSHAVVLVGYNDAGKYWIIKNSWGTGWGNGGYGKVGYGECEIETRNNKVMIN